MRILPVCLLILMVYSCKPTQAELQNPIPRNNKISVWIGIHNDHLNEDSVRVSLIDSWGNHQFEFRGKPKGWGMVDPKQEITLGDFTLEIEWLEDLHKKVIRKKIHLVDEIRLVTINIELSNRGFNGIYLDKYFDNIYEAKLIRSWDPQKQFENDSSLLPSYQIINQSDSILYGKYLRFSSALSINWIQKHSIAFLNYQELIDGEWVYKSCPAPRIGMNLEKDQTGSTFEGMGLECNVDSFQVGRNYRIRIDYMVNDLIREEAEKTEFSEDYIYVEQHVFTVNDEFILN